MRFLKTEILAALLLTGSFTQAIAQSVWTVRSSGTTIDLRYVTWAGTQLVAGGYSGTILTSPNGTAWTTQNSGTSNTLYSVASTGSLLAAVFDGGSNILTSTNGVTWTPRALGSNNNLYAISWTGTQLVAVGYPGKAYTSPDGITWTSRTAGGSGYLWGLTWTGTQLVAVGDAPGSGIILTSPDGITWTVRTSGTTHALYSVTWTGSQLVAVGAVGVVLTSPDGITWTTRSSGTTNNLSSVTWTGTQLVAVGDNRTVISSLNGINWATQSSGMINWLGSVTSMGSQLVAVGQAGIILTSPMNRQFTQQGNKLVGTGAVGNAWHGISVALSSDGNTAIVGGHGDNNFAGAVWAWTRSGGIWTQQGNKLVGTGVVGTEAWQGRSVSLSSDGNTAIIGGSADNNHAGAIWAWTRSGGVWTQQGGKLVGTGTVGTEAWQGQSASLSSDGNTAIVGGYGDSSSKGAAWVWTRSGGVWTQQGSKLVGSGAVGTTVYQGYSVSLSGDGNTALVGGYSDNSNAGAAWVWTRSGGVWTQQGSKLVGTGAVGNAKQGYAVSLSGDGNTAIVGGLADSGRGAVWVWTRSGGVWTQQGNKLVGTGAVGTGDQGRSVSLSSDGNTAIIGSENDNGDAGAVWIWTRSGGVWAQKSGKLVGTGAGPYPNPSEQGYSVAISSDGNTAIEGAYGDDGDVGAAWVYVATPAIPALSTPSNNATGVPIVTNLFWAVSSGAATYRVQLSTDSNFVSNVVNDSTLTGTSRAVGPLTNNTVYYWRVNAKNSAGTSDYSSIWKFMTAPPIPAPCDLISPANNATVYSPSANLIWNASTGATTYHVQVSTNSGFTTTVVNDSTLTTTTWSFPYTNYGVYYWRVNAKNASGTSAYSPTWNFTTATTGIVPKEISLQYLNLGSGKVLQFALPQRAHLVIQLFNSKGRMVSQLLDETRNAGYYTMPLTSEAKGSYFLDFHAGDFHRTMKIQP